VNRSLARPAVFGLADGAMSIMGVVLYVAGHTGLVFPVAVSGGVSAAASMASGEWLSESENGPLAAVTIGGRMLPAVPYAFLRGAWAPAVSVAMLAVVAAVVARLRAHRRHPYLETAAALAVVLALSAACALLIT
jgi:VIT1/CCC1 family predicted Fe2+/Mn2+ transporter